MASELTSDQEKLLKAVVDNIPIVKDLGLEKTFPCWLTVHDSLADLKLVEPPAPGDRLAVWLKFSVPGKFEEHPGYDDVRHFVIDGAAKIPKYSFRYIDPGMEIFDDADPSNCRRYTYGMEEVYYPLPETAEIPFTVSRQVVEVFDLISDTDRLKLGKRTNVLVNRQIYHKPHMTDIFAPFSLISTSVFAVAPDGYNQGLLETEGEWWLETSRTFHYKAEDITYKRSPLRVMEKQFSGIFPLHPSERFVSSLGTSDEIFFPKV